MEHDKWEKCGEGIFSTSNILQTEWKSNARAFSPASLDLFRDPSHDIALELLEGQCQGGAQEVRFYTVGCSGLCSTHQLRDHHHLTAVHSLLPWCSCSCSRWIKLDEVQTHSPSASFVKTEVVFGTGTSDTEGVLTSNYRIFSLAWNLCAETLLIKVQDVSVKLMPVTSLLPHVRARQWRCGTSCCSDGESLGAFYFCIAVVLGIITGILLQPTSNSEFTGPRWAHQASLC